MVKSLTLFGAGYSPMSLMEEIDSDLRETWAPEVFYGHFTVPMEIREDADAIVVKTEVPGIKMEDLEVTLLGDVLTVKAERKAAADAEGETTRTYARSVSLPFEADAGKIKAFLEDGILEITITKPEEVKPQKIDIKTRAAHKKAGKP